MITFFERENSGQRHWHELRVETQLLDVFFVAVGTKSLAKKKENRAAAIQYKKQKLSLLLTTFKRERFNGLSRAGVSIYELPVALLQQTVLISNRLNFFTNQPEPPVAKTFNCVIRASICCIYSSSLILQEILSIGELKKASTVSFSKGFPTSHK